VTIKISFTQHKHNFADNIWGGVPIWPWVLGVKIERCGVRFEPVLNIHTPFPPNLTPQFVSFCTFSTNGFDERQHPVYFVASWY
jgi:hypothetical protein